MKNRGYDHLEYMGYLHEEDNKKLVSIVLNNIDS